MMKLCEAHDCTQWAQWRGEWPDRVHHLLCQTHRDAIHKQDEERAAEAPDYASVKFMFCGAIPDGIDRQ